MNWTRQLFLKLFNEQTPIKTDTGLDLSDINVEVSSTAVKRVPKELLSFKEANIPRSGSAFCVGYDKKIYTISASDSTLRKYDEITSDNPTAETGIVWDVSQWGDPIRMMVFPQGVSIFTNYVNGDIETVRAYHLDSFEDDTPTMVYESDGPSCFITSRNQFGVKYYYTGVGSIVLCGVYGRGTYEKDLIYSDDGGQSFTVIKKNKGADPNPNENSHWHDVALDIHSGAIWASEGDGQINSDVHVTYDLGATWQTLNPQGARHPTAIMPFPNRVVFGRDRAGIKPGFDYFEKPLIEADYEPKENDYKTLKEFRVDLPHSSRYYVTSPINNGVEGYFSFMTQQTPHLIAGTGDGGQSIHFLHWGSGEKPNSDSITVDNLRGMDDEYIYGGIGGRIVYAKKPEWVDY